MAATCEVCGNPFDAQRSTARFCSEACKKRAQRAPAEEPKEAEPAPEPEAVKEPEPAPPQNGSPSLEKFLQPSLEGEVARAVSANLHPLERRASLGGVVYPGRPEPSGTVMWGEHTSAPQREYRVVRNCSISEDEYVNGELAVTKAQMQAGKLKEVIDTRPGPGKNKGRMWRCERYARWRYRGFLAGEIASL